MQKKDKQILSVLRQKQKEVSDLPVQRFGVLTPHYKLLIPYLKTKPWKVIILVSFSLVILFRIFFGASFVKLAAILQAGF